MSNRIRRNRVRLSGSEMPERGDAILRRGLADSERTILDQVHWMADIVRQYRMDPLVVRTARTIVSL